VSKEPKRLPQKTLLPRQVMERLEGVLRPVRARLPSRLHAPCDELMRVLLPPPDAIGISWAVKYFMQVRPEGFDSLLPVAKKLQEVLQHCVPHPLPKLKRSDHYGILYPVFFGLRKIAKRAPGLKRKGANPSALAGLFLELCKKGHASKDLSADVYYFDVLAVRDVLDESLRTLGLGGPDSRDIDTLRNAVVANATHLVALYGKENVESAMPMSHWENRIAKLRRIVHLVNGKRKFGVPEWIPGPIRRPGGRRSGVKPRANPREIKHHDERRLNASLTVEDGTAVLPYGAECEIVTTLRVGATGNTRRAASQVPTACELTRRPHPGGSCLAPKDDRRAARSRIDGIRSRSVASCTDASRLPLPSIVRFLNMLFAQSPIGFCFAWICLTTGLLPDVLEKTRRSSNRKGVRCGEPVIDTGRAMLYYVLEGGPTDLKGKREGHPSDSHIVRTPIPHQIVAIILAQGEDLPFRGMDKTIAKLADSFQRRWPGLAPTASRLSRSYWLHLPPLGLRDGEAAFISSDVPTRYGAHTDYYRLARHPLHVRYTAAIGELARAINAHASLSAGFRDWAATLTFCSPPSPPGPGIKDAYLGSQIATDLTKLEPFFKETRNRMQYYHERIARTLPHEILPLLVEALKLANVQFYVLQDFMGVRPRGDIAVISHSTPGYGALVEDKGSAHYREFSLSPLLPVLVAQLDACLSSMKRVQDYCKQYGFRFVDKRRAKTDLMAADFRLVTGSAQHKTPPTLVAVTMTSKRYRKALFTLGLGQFCPVQYNELRHSTISHFESRIPMPALAQWSGHHLPGHDMFAPWSSSDVSSYFDELKEVQRYLTALNPQIISAPENI
jgi:hypothetical protein